MPDERIVVAQGESNSQEFLVELLSIFFRAEALGITDYYQVQSELDIPNRGTVLITISRPVDTGE